MSAKRFPHRMVRNFVAGFSTWMERYRNSIGDKAILGGYQLNIVEFVRAPELINGELSLYQETALKLFYGLPLSNEQVEVAKSALDLQELLAPREFEEGTFVCVRR